MIYTKEQILEAMRIGSGWLNADDERLHDHYVLVEVELDKLILANTTNAAKLTEQLTNKNWLDYVNFTPPDYEGLGVIAELITMYSSGEVVHPIVLTDDFIIVDGHHRFAAANSLGIKSLKMYVPIAKGDHHV